MGDGLQKSGHYMDRQMPDAVNHEEKYSLCTVPCSKKTSLKNSCEKLVLALNVTLPVLKSVT